MTLNTVSLQTMHRFLLFLPLIVLISCSKDTPKISLSPYPDGKNFAFTITEDPDYATLTQKYSVYNFLDSIGFKTTVAAWVMDNSHGSGNDNSRHNTRGITTADTACRAFMQHLQKKGFEICLHTVSPGNDYREETQAGYELFKQQFGDYPQININHANNLEDIYWGVNRFPNGLLKDIYGIFNTIDFQGEKAGSKYFWGDICKEKTKFVRAWATDNINTLAVNPTMPYHEKNKPYVNWWFGCSDGGNCAKFKRLLSDANLAVLNKQRGTSVVYTHFAYGFVNADGVLDQEVKNQLTKISTMSGWFVPASTILNRFIQMRNLAIVYNKDKVTVVNTSRDTLKGLTLLSHWKKWFIENTCKWQSTNDENELIVGDLPPQSAVCLSSTGRQPLGESPSFFEKIMMLWQWMARRP